MGSSRRLAAVAGILLLLATGCGPARPDAGGEAPPADAGHSLQPQQSGPGRESGGGLDHVVIIVEENRPAAEVLGSASAPFINQLAADYALAANYSAVTHPSLPNYLALTGGTTAGITADCLPAPGSCQARGDGITGQIGQSGRTWKMYAEGMPGPCTAKNSGLYAVKHNPFMYYPGITGDAAYCAAHVVPFARLAGDLKTASTLPDYVFISPDLCHDMHNCPVETGDAWLARQVAKILASPAFTRQHSLLVLTWDEGRGNRNKVATIFAGPAARASYRSDTAYDHYSLLHTIENAWGLDPLTGNDGNAPVMNELLR
ncbi:alkaline phosphatase family protein [Arthrobacter sp. GCM10027362]|uniref:alkaline phosphatase family protein n=1 Tax=Arthrobacter sp. GCM10027362 TaxID=3273379 RepID=UPI003629B5D7